LGFVCAIQEDSEELEEPKQVVYKENDVDSTLSDGSENSNDSVESRIEGSRNNFLEKNGWYLKCIS
jgi:alpha-1,4-galacturonosyltransferase